MIGERMGSDTKPGVLYRRYNEVDACSYADFGYAQWVVFRPGKGSDIHKPLNQQKAWQFAYRFHDDIEHNNAERKRIVDTLIDLLRVGGYWRDEK